MNSCRQNSLSIATGFDDLSCGVVLGGLRIARGVKFVPNRRYALGGLRISESSGLSLVFAVLVDASAGWRGVRIKPHIEKRLKQMATDPDSQWVDPDLAKVAA